MPYRIREWVTFWGFTEWEDREDAELVRSLLCEAYGLEHDDPEGPQIIYVPENANDENHPTRQDPTD